jgi:diadenosine tetraphosphate (Ap4A) HIT family hydrolase
MSDMSGRCLACEMVGGVQQAPGGILFENAHWQVDHINHPVMLKGMLIVRLKRHCETFAEITPAEAASLGGVLQSASAALMAVLHPERIYLCLFGEGLRHVHFFVIPRMPGMPRSSWGAFTWLRVQSALHMLRLRKSVSHHEIMNLADQLRAAWPHVQPDETGAG